MSVALALALLALLFTVTLVQRMYRYAFNLRISRDRAELDLQLVAHQNDQMRAQTKPPRSVCDDSRSDPGPAAPPRFLLGSPPASIPPGPPSSRGSRITGRGGRGRAGSSQSGSSVKSGSDGGGRGIGSNHACSEASVQVAASTEEQRFLWLVDATIAAICEPAWEAAVAALRPSLNLLETSIDVDGYERYVKQLWVIVRKRGQVEPEIAFETVSSITEAMTVECHVPDPAHSSST